MYKGWSKFWGHCEYNLQGSGQVERMNRTLKETLTKLTIETGGDWVALLPFSLFRVCNTPYKLNLTPSEILYGRPAPVCPIFEGKCLPAPCVLVAVMPKILYHSEEVMYSHWDQEMLRQKREPISVITIATLFSLGLEGARFWGISSKL